MSSPAASDSADHVKKPLEQITFRFCSECSNMLYPKEHENDHKLMFTCRTCSYSEEAKSSCIFRNILNNAAGETAGVTQDVGSDPTVGTSSATSAGASMPSPNHSGSSSSPDASAYLYCLCCGRFITCDVCRNHYAIDCAHRVLSDFKQEDVPTGLDVVDVVQSDDDGSHYPLPGRNIASFMARTEEYQEYDDEGDSMEDDEPVDAAYEEMLPRAHQICPLCKHTEAVFFQSQQRSAETGMKLFYVCCNGECGHIFQSDDS
ncbi:hypothetical protein B0T22DRAFT_387637 [Podospora appendiculata]|uniref:DNA-directed RNA polymerase II subunit RPB9 n=1 Tax=Podospora appendiculata TaxID=314037 RepID=A0AAE0WZS9_9PEZI|nr:hypothetical protein B0T22DRAFT_387637 [Podospora appendiculata]